MKHINTTPLYQSLKLTRNLINISFLIIFLILLFWGNYNPAAAFAMKFAVAGATRTSSANSASAMCST